MEEKRWVQPTLFDLLAIPPLATSSVVYVAPQQKKNIFLKAPSLSAPKNITFTAPKKVPQSAFFHKDYFASRTRLIELKEKLQTIKQELKNYEKNF